MVHGGVDGQLTLRKDEERREEEEKEREQGRWVFER